MITTKDMQVEWRSPERQKELYDAGQCKDEPLPYDVCIVTAPAVFLKTSFDTRTLGPLQGTHAKAELERRAKTAVMRNIYSNVMGARDAIFELREFCETHTRVDRATLDDKFAPLIRLLEPLH